MAKTGREKNTKNKAKHTKFLERKKSKLRIEKQLRKGRLTVIIQKSKENKEL